MNQYKASPNILLYFLLLTSIGLSALPSAKADNEVSHIDLMIGPRGSAVEIDYPLQTVMIEDEAWQFEAHLKFCGPQLTTGNAKLSPPNRDPLSWTALAVEHVRQEGSPGSATAQLILMANNLSSRTTPDIGTEFVVVRLPSQIKEEDIWALMGPESIGGGGATQFAVERITSNSEERCDKATPTYPVINKVKAVEQEVFPEDRRDPTTFAARVKLLPNYHARGFVEVSETNYDILFGTTQHSPNATKTVLFGWDEDRAIKPNGANPIPGFVSIVILYTQAVPMGKKYQPSTIDIDTVDDQLSFEAEILYKFNPKLWKLVR